METQVQGQAGAENAVARDADSGCISCVCASPVPSATPHRGPGVPLHTPVGRTATQPSRKHSYKYVSSRGAGPSEHPPLGYANVLMFLPGGDATHPGLFPLYGFLENMPVRNRRGTSFVSIRLRGSKRRAHPGLGEKS